MYLGHARPFPKLGSPILGVLQTLLHEDAVVGPNQLAHDGRFTQRRIEGLVPSPFGVVQVLSNDPPFTLDEGGRAEDLVGMAEAIEDESGFVSVGHPDGQGGVAYSWVRLSLSRTTRKRH